MFLRWVATEGAAGIVYRHVLSNICPGPDQLPEKKWDAFLLLLDFYGVPQEGLSSIDLGVMYHHWQNSIEITTKWKRPLLELAMDEKLSKRDTSKTKKREKRRTLPDLPVEFWECLAQDKEEALTA